MQIAHPIWEEHRTVLISLSERWGFSANTGFVCVEGGIMILRRCDLAIKAVT